MRICILSFAKGTEVHVEQQNVFFSIKQMICFELKCFFFIKQMICFELKCAHWILRGPLTTVHGFCPVAPVPLTNQYAPCHHCLCLRPPLFLGGGSGGESSRSFVPCLARVSHFPRPMAPPPPLSWADAPPYHYHGTPLPPPPPPSEEEEATGGGGGCAGGPEEARSLWIGGLLPWMNEDYLYSCFTRVPELVSIFVRRNKHTGKSAGFGFLNFTDHATAAHILQSYSGQKMPNADRNFRLNWDTHPQPPSDDQHSELNWGTLQQDPPPPPQGHTDDTSDHKIYVGDLDYNVTAFMLQHVFQSRYLSVESATVIYDKVTGRSKGYGFVSFGDASECRQAMTEMNGAYCSTRRMRIGPVPNKKMHPHGTQGIDFHHQDPNNARLFVSLLGESVTSEDLKQAFTPYGELVNVKLLEGKNCGFVTYSNRASAEEAIRMLNGTQLGGSTIKVSFARPHPNKQDQLNIGHRGRPQCYGPGLGWSPHPYAFAQIGPPGNGSFQQQQPQVQ